MSTLGQQTRTSTNVVKSEDAEDWAIENGAEFVPVNMKSDTLTGACIVMSRRRQSVLSCRCG